MSGDGRRWLSVLRRHPAAADALLAIMLGVAALMSAYATFALNERVNPAFVRPSDVEAAVSMLGITLPLAWRRRFPLTVALAVVSAFLLARVVFDVGESQVTVLAGSLGIYSAAVHGRPPGRIPVLVVAFTAILGEVFRELFFAEPVLHGLPFSQTFLLAFNGVVLALPWLLGIAIRGIRRREDELVQQAVELRREREENARRAVFEERVRIARELHDVVAHHVSVMGVQAGAARRVMGSQPASAEGALRSIEEASRQAVLELQRMLGFLRREGEADDLAPQPGLGELDGLVDQVRQANLEVAVSVEGQPQPLSRSLEVCAYRIIQEALTNTIKHGGAGSATVCLRYEPSVFEVEVFDDGKGTSTATDPHRRGGGHGLIGMRERVSLHGGQLKAGPRPNGGFGVDAVFPLDAGSG